MIDGRRAEGIVLELVQRSFWIRQLPFDDGHGGLLTQTCLSETARRAVWWGILHTGPLQGKERVRSDDERGPISLRRRRRERYRNEKPRLALGACRSAAR